MLQIYNVLLKLNYFLNAWKLEELFSFLKSNKQKKRTQKDLSYKPISLLTILGKIFEKIILNRINYIFRNSQERNFLDIFILSKSTELAFQKVTSLIDLNIDKKTYISLLSTDSKKSSIYFRGMLA